MPHSESDMTTNGPTTSTSSSFLSHFYSFPIVHDSVTAFKDNPYGQKTLSISSAAYDKIVTPFNPILTKVNGYASPYISKADKLADSGLGKVESFFPIVKEPTGKIVGYPKSVYDSRREYLTSVYSQEYTKADGSKGMVNTAKAGVMTGRVVTGDLLHWFASFLSQKKEEAKEIVNEKTG